MVQGPISYFFAQLVEEKKNEFTLIYSDVTSSLTGRCSIKHAWHCGQAMSAF